MSICDTCFTNHKCAKFEKGERLDCQFCIKQFKLGALYDMALVSDKQRRFVGLRYDANGTDRDEFVQLSQVQANINQFVESGSNLYIHSTGCGNGKTSWSLRLLQTYLNSVWFKSAVECKALFINVPKFFLMLKDNISHENEYIQHIKKYAASCDLVIWDDIGTKVGTEFEVENLLSIINSRSEAGKSNIYTSNISPLQLKERVGERLYSRVVNASRIIELKGADKRGIQG